MNSTLKAPRSKQADSPLAAVRPGLREFRGYQSAGGPKPKQKPSVRLDANESPWEAVPNLSSDQVSALNRYPQPRPELLREKMGEYYGVGADQILLTLGSDAAIDLLVRACCSEGQDRILIQSPTFAMYEVAARLQGAEVIDVPLLQQQDFAIDEAALLAACREQMPRLVFVCSPNNPTGGETSLTLIKGLCEILAGRGLVVVDEAYQEFSSLASALSQLNELPNLVVLRTLSKAHALAGIRCGALIANPELVSFLSSLLAPYPLPATTIALATQAFSTQGLAATQQRIENLLQLKQALVDALDQVSLVKRVLAGAANFVLVQVDGAAEICTALSEQFGVRVRFFPGEPELAHWLRISIGTDEENQTLLAALGALS